MRDYRITDDNEEIEAIFLTFDADKTDTISYDEFLRAVVGEMNVRRQNICLLAFQKMDVDGNGVLDISDIKFRYNAKRHPDVMMGKRSEDDVLYEFLDTFEAYYS